ncbi:MAG: hypothetical protein HUU20_12725 [Pirellulales bacterium]|nr:hypothetical protein [Pirellulales bacterium]
MRHLLPAVIIISLPMWTAALASAAAPKAVWSEEAETFATPGGMRFGTALADDGTASGGKAVRIPFRADANGWSMVFSAPRMEMRGQVLFTFWLRAEDVPPLTPGFKLTLVAHDKHSGSWAFHRETRVYGANLRAQGYTAVTLALDAPWTGDTYGPEVILQWDAPPKGVVPVMYLDKAEIAVPAFDAPRVLEISPLKIRYGPGEQVVIRTSLVNPTAAPVEAALVGEEIRAADTRREVFRENVRLAAGEEKQVASSYVLGPEEYGREIRVRLLVGAQEVAAGRDFFAVSRLPLWGAGGSSGDRSYWAGNSGAGSFYVGPASGQDSWRGAQYWKKMRRVYFEFFSWAPGDISDLAPTDDLFPGGEGRLAYRSRQTILQQNRMLRSVGIWPVSYGNGTCWAESGYKLFQQHPEWFLYDANGEIAGYEMDGRELYRRKDDADFDPGAYQHIFFQACLNHSLPAVQEYVARQFIRCGREMGFAGVRLDVRYLEVYPGERGFDGKEVATTYPEADRISAAAVKRIKALVHKELPEFTFGYNYAAPEEVKDMMATFQERCEGGAWMLDELPCTYQEKTSSYHVWKTYVRRMMSWADQVNNLGGVYNPYDFNRGSMEHSIDLIYSAIFRIICGGRDYGGWYHNSRQPVGDYGAFTTRFSEYLHNANRDWIADPQGEVEVRSAAPLWWEDMCFRTRSSDGRKCLQVNLVNPPKAAEVMENPRSEINPPVRDITVICAPSEGQKPAAACLLAGEPMELTGLNEIQVVQLDLRQADGGKVAVTVPSVLFWKMVVFQF